ncbi:uncharacterized protein LOC144342155 [Saccoglossus kowalevskii]
MEVEGTVSFFSRSLETHNFRYTSFIGDGDSSAYNSVKYIYGDDYIVQREDCMGHVQKRMGTQLRSLVEKEKGQKLGDGRALTGQGRLTKKVINNLQTLYGIAVIMPNYYTHI